MDNAQIIRSLLTFAADKSGNCNQQNSMKPGACGISCDIDYF